MRIWYYPRCDSCRKALKWLDAHGATYEKVDIVAAPPDAETLRGLWQRSGLPIRRFFNTSGQSYRQGGFKDRLAAGLTDDEALAAFAADGKLIKRPVLDLDATVLVGFREAEYAQAVGS